jgi:hypothetical protein
MMYLRNILNFVLMDFMVVTLASQCSFFDSYMGATYNIADLTRYDSCEMIFVY